LDLREVPPSTNGATPSTKVCRTCEPEKPADQFGKGRPCVGIADASRAGLGKRSVLRVDASNAYTRQKSPSTTTRRVPEPTPSRRPSPPRRNGYRLEAGIYARLAEQRRAVIEAAPTTLEERDGRTWLVRRLPSVSEWRGSKAAALPTPRRRSNDRP
jgi:hypothetical protein